MKGKNSSDPVARFLEEFDMSANSGEQAREGGNFLCAECNRQVHVNKGTRIPKCPECGNDTFDVRTDETSGAHKD